MTAINKTITLTWEGKDYPLIINMYHIDRIEESGINLLSLANDCAMRDLKLSKATKLITVLLQLAGVEELADIPIVEAQEKVWEAMCSDGQASIADILILVSEILKVVFFRSKKKSTPKKKKKS